MSPKTRCSKCSRKLSNEVFFYNGKIHKTCFNCSDSRKTTKNKCQTCGIRARYNYKGQEEGIFCLKHSKADMVDIKSPKCITCKEKGPNFNYAGETKALYCSVCALADMIDIKNPKCITCKEKGPNFNYAGETKALYCSVCALADMVDIKHPKCITCKEKAPNFNYAGETKRLYCSVCALDNMVNIKSPKCITCKEKQPVFNYAGETKALYCSVCALAGMINIKSPKCITCKEKEPVFNYAGETKALYCSVCSLADMVDIKNPKCITCKEKQPAFNYTGETKALYCSVCALDDMVNIRSPKCITCKKTASYGLPCNRPNKCTLHKEDGMIKNPTARCRKKTCNNTAIYGSKTPLHCEAHKVSDDVLLVERHCEKCGILDVLLNGLCVNFCCMEEKALEIKKYQKVKEKRVLKILSVDFKEPTEYNIRIPYDCGGKHSEEKEIGYDFNTHKVFVEVDENQHKSYCEVGETNRMRNIYMSEGGIPIVFIRYNPDNFMISGKKCKISQANREIQLVKWLEHYESFENIKNPLTVHYLYYDEKLSEIIDIEPY